MPVIKDVTGVSGPVSNAIKKGNFALGVNSLEYGATANTGYWNCIEPSAGKYVLYIHKGTQGPSIYTPQNNTDLINLAIMEGGTSISTAAAAIQYFSTQSNMILVNRSYENIVTSGIVFMVDAGFSASYPTTGTNFYDISGNEVTGILVNSPSYNTSGSGCIALDGSSTYINHGTNNLGVDVSNKTVCVWTYPTSASNGTFIDKDFDNTGGGGGSNYGGWGFWMNSSQKMWWWAHPGKDLIDTGTSLSLNTWNHACVTWNTSTKSATFYLNGSTTTTQTNSGIVEQASTGINLEIGAFRNNTGSFFNGRIAIVQVYNRVLSSSEISTNFNAQRSRFGI